MTIQISESLCIFGIQLQYHNFLCSNDFLFFNVCHSFCGCRSFCICQLLNLFVYLFFYPQWWFWSLCGGDLSFYGLVVWNTTELFPEGDRIWNEDLAEEVGVNIWSWLTLCSNPPRIESTIICASKETNLVQFSFQTICCSWLFFSCLQAVWFHCIFKLFSRSWRADWEIWWGGYPKLIWNLWLWKECPSRGRGQNRDSNLKCLQDCDS